MTDLDPLLTAYQLSKVYPGERAKNQRRQRERIVALDNFTFDLFPGEIVGLIGGNGSGKTTLLRLLAGTSMPSAGRINLRARPRVIISLGGGLQPSLTARENIYLLGCLLGLTRSELKKSEQSILDFSGLADLADEPVRQFSLGMRLRLAFAVATSGRPSVMLIDEIISAGDAAWQITGLGRLQELREQGSGLLIASHDLDTLGMLADRLVWLDRGRIKKIGRPAEIIAAYRSTI